jgi:beta-lactamase class A
VIEVSAELGALEDEFAARVGVYLLDTGTGATVEYRADESFAFASTIKAVLAGVALDAVPPEVGSEVITYNAADIVSYSPITEKHLDTGMTLQELAHAAMAYSDNTAANLLFAQIGGPAALQSALRALGDTTTSSDRIETELNEWAPGETRDTSTPRAMAQTLQKMVLGDALREDTRAFLLQTLRDNTTGDELIRAGAPEGWTVGDKSGASEHGGRNDIAILERPDGAPVVLAIYSNRLDPAAAYDNGLVAQAARIALNALLG